MDDIDERRNKMSLIFNNKDYRLVSDGSDWNKLEYVVARKLHVEFRSSETPSIDTIKESFGIYGGLTKIEIFQVLSDGQRYVHITYKESRAAYCAMLDVKVNEKDDVAVIRLADARLQPDNPIGSNDSPFYNLPEACLLAICDNCDFHMLALLSTVCKKFSEFLRVRVFFKYPRFNAETSSLADVQNGLLTAARLVQCVKPKNFYFKMYRNFVSSIDWPKLSLDMVATSSEICLEMDFFKPELLANLQRISGRIKSLHLHRTVYHSDFYQIKNSCAGVSFPEVTNLTISCYAMSCYIPEFSPITIASPKLETITFRKGNIKWKNVILFCELAKQLRTVIFEECCFDQDIGHSDIREVAVLIQKRDKLKPLRMIFGRISVKKPQTLMAPVEEKLCQCLRCPRCKYQRGSPSDLFQCSCKVCQYCELNRVKNKYATQPTIVNSIEESSYEGIKEALKDPEIRTHIFIQVGRTPFSD